MSRREILRSRAARRLAGKLAAYSAAGMSLAPAEAAAGIVYTNLQADPVSVVSDVFDLDLNRDGSADFQLVHSRSSSAWVDGCNATILGGSACFSSGRKARGTALVRGVNHDNTVVANSAGLALNLPSGASIFQPGQSPALVARYTHSSSQRVHGNHATSSRTGEFGYYSDSIPSSRGFIGLLFDIPGSGRHAAWADVEVLGYPVRGVRLYGYAFETEPDVPIRAGAVPEPPSLVLLAAGAAGLAALRRKRRSMDSESAPSGR